MRAVEESTIDRRGLVALYVLYQLTWTIAMFYAWPEGYRLPPKDDSGERRREDLRCVTI